jgi:hypothetical protein
MYGVLAGGSWLRKIVQMNSITGKRLIPHHPYVWDVNERGTSIDWKKNARAMLHAHTHAPRRQSQHRRMQQVHSLMMLKWGADRSDRAGYDGSFC